MLQHGTQQHTMDNACRAASARSSPSRRPRPLCRRAAGRTMTTLSWIFCHRCARKIWMSEILSVGILPCMKMPVRSSCTWKPTYTLARLMVGLHQSVKRRLGIWFRPERCALVSFLNFMLSSKPARGSARCGRVRAA